MVTELGRICNSFTEDSLEALASVHLRDAIQVLKEASEYCHTVDTKRHPGSGWVFTAQQSNNRSRILGSNFTDANMTNTENKS